MLDEAVATAYNGRTSTSRVVRKVIFAEGGMVDSDQELEDGLNTTQAAQISVSTSPPYKICCRPPVDSGYLTEQS